MKITKSALFLLPTVFSLVILYICYPGFMSYDSIRMLEEARSSVRGNPFPAAPVYILRLFDITGHGSTLMLQAENFVLLLSVMIILRGIGASLVGSVSALLALLAMPTVIGCMLVLWKDVTLTSLMIASVAMIFWASQTNSLENKENYRFKTVKWCSLFLLILSTLMRLNAITSTAIIVLYWLTVFYGLQGWKMRGGAFIAILICMVASDKVINNYTFPSLNKLPPNTILYAVMAYDLVGMSNWSNASLVPFDAAGSNITPKASISDVNKIYSSLGALAMGDKNIALGNAVKLFPLKYENKDIAKAWFAAVCNHPLAYMRYRWDIFAEIIGAKFHATFEPTHYNRIDENSLGIEFQDRPITKVMLKYIHATSNIFIGKPWFVFLLSLVSAFLVFRNHLILPELKRLSLYSFSAAILYISPFFVISGTGEVRYCFPAIVLSSIPIFVWSFAYYLPRHNVKIQPIG